MADGLSPYSVAVTRDFTARHFLVGGDWGPENDLHSHRYRLEVKLTGSELNQHGYLLDIDNLKSMIEAAVREFEGNVLNSQPAFRGLNPSLEHFARILANRLGDPPPGEGITALQVRLGEDEHAWAEYRMDLG